MSILVRVSDITRTLSHVRFVPKADILHCGRDWRYSITSSARSPEPLTRKSWGRRRWLFHQAQRHARDQKHRAKQGTDEIKVVTWTVWQAPAHARKQVEFFGDVGEHHDR
jgi:hypothetical protein